MLKPLQTEFKGRTITLECTHKRAFPPPQMYGSTPEDIDNLWRQGRVDQGQYQHLTTWREACGLMIMGPKCLDCPLALTQTPRPGRPDVIETSPWLEDKEKMRWDDMKAAKGDRSPVDKDPAAEVNEVSSKKAGFVKRGAPVPVAVVEPTTEPEPGSAEEQTFADVLAQGNTGMTTIEIPEEAPKAEEPAKKKRSSKKRSSKKKGAAAEEPKPAPSSEEPEPPAEAEPDTKPVDDAPGALDDSILDALADD